MGLSGSIAGVSCPDVLWEVQNVLAKSHAGVLPSTFVLSMDQEKCFDRLDLGNLMAIADKLNLDAGKIALTNYAKLTRLLFVDNEPSDVWLQGDVLKMRVKLHEIEKRSYAAKETRQTQVKVELAIKDIFDTILDVRGQRVADALETVHNFVDHCAASGIGPIYIRHGHGTGALKQAIRTWLKQSSYKVQISTGPQALGGDGTTQVDF